MEGELRLRPRAWLGLSSKALPQALASCIHGPRSALSVPWTELGVQTPPPRSKGWGWVGAPATPLTQQTQEAICASCVCSVHRLCEVVATQTVPQSEAGEKAGRGTAQPSQGQGTGLWKRAGSLGSHTVAPPAPAQPQLPHGAPWMPSVAAPLPRAAAASPHAVLMAGHSHGLSSRHKAALNTPFLPFILSLGKQAPR